jgi:predicted signal transduction protein with EAL and GGDEF domain
VSYHTKEGLLCGVGLLTLAAVGYGMSHTHALLWVYFALAGIAGLFSVFYLRSRK